MQNEHQHKELSSNDDLLMLVSKSHPPTFDSTSRFYQVLLVLPFYLCLFNFRILCHFTNVTLNLLANKKPTNVFFCLTENHDSSLSKHEEAPLAIQRNLT